MKDQTTYDFIDESQAPNYYPPATLSPSATTKKISMVDFINSNDGATPTFYAMADTTQTLGDSSANTKTSVMSNVQNTKVSIVDFINKNSNPVDPAYSSSSSKVKNINVTNVPYPRFSEGEPYFTILSDIQNKKDELVSVMIDGVSVKQGCAGAKYKQGKTYDFYIINLTMDDHPIHIHLVNFQVVGRFKFNTRKYRKDWEAKNGELVPGGIGKIPSQIDVRPYKIGPIIPPMEEEKQFLDVIRVPS